MIANAGSYANSAGAVPTTSRNACCSACDPATRPRSLPHLCPPPAVDRCQSPTFAAVDRLAGSRPLENGRPGRRRDPSRTRRCHDRSLRPSVGGTYRPAGSGAIRTPTVHGIEQVRQPRRSGVRFAGRCQNWGMLRGRLDGSGRPDRRELFAESVRFGFTGRLSPVDTVVAQAWDLGQRPGLAAHRAKDSDGNYVATFAGASPGITGLGRPPVGKVVSITVLRRS